MRRNLYWPFDGVFSLVRRKIAPTLAVAAICFYCQVATAQLGNAQAAPPPKPSPPERDVRNLKPKTNPAPINDQLPQPDVSNAGGDANGAGQAEVRTEQRGRLGVFVTSTTGRLSVGMVNEGGAATRAGIEAGDEIISVNGRRVSTVGELTGSLRAAGDGDGQATIVISRNGQLQTIVADVSGRSAANGAGDQQSPKRITAYYRAPARVPVDQTPIPIQPIGYYTYYAPVVYPGYYAYYRPDAYGPYYAYAPAYYYPWGYYYLPVWYQSYYGLYYW